MKEAREYEVHIQIKKTVNVWAFDEEEAGDIACVELENEDINSFDMEVVEVNAI